MELGEWKQVDDGHYEIIEKFGSFFYSLSLHITDMDTKSYFWVSLSSGKKKKHFNNFDPDNLKRDGGIKPLIWAKNKILERSKHHIRNYPDYVSVFIVIRWSNSQRRIVYSKLISEGFYFGEFEGKTCLIKKIK